MRKLVLFMHTSLDGYVAGPKGELDWITVDDDIFDFVGKRTNSADTALYGRVTYEMMQAYWPAAGISPTHRNTISNIQNGTTASRRS